MIHAPVSDRERSGLHGPVKSVVDEWSTTEFDQDGKILEWTGNTSHGRVERKYVYDQAGKLIRISGSNGDWVDEFRYKDADPNSPFESRARTSRIWHRGCI